jgi:oxygen-independent coproporphyrinogen-3 oxidase
MVLLVGDKLAVYIHWPYCARICPYCDFNVYKQKTDEGLTSAILSDLKGWRYWSGPREVSSIHFGGGTPSLMSAEDISNIVSEVKNLWGLSERCEIAIEANPHDADASTWKAYHVAGINRLSLGVQSFQDSALKLLGRDHDAASAKAALELAVDVFPSVSLDIIFGWTGQTEALLSADLDIALKSGVQHISTYQLTIEEGTAFARAEARGNLKAVDEDKSADFYEFVRERLTTDGYDHYEVSNFAKPGYRSQHNLAYWRGQDYIGVGPGAHGRLTVEGTRYATVAEMRPQTYQDKVAATGLGLAEKEALSRTAWAEEYLLMGLRIEEGISLARFEKISGKRPAKETIQELVQNSLLNYDEDRIITTSEGRLLLNAVTEKLLV